jgi:hypothetical protein
VVEACHFDCVVLVETIRDAEVLPGKSDLLSGRWTEILGCASTLNKGDF